MPTPPSDAPAKPGDVRPVANISVGDRKCEDCGGPVTDGDLFIYDVDRIVCLACAGLDRLIFLPSGNTALTRRATKHSRLSAVVMKYSRQRKRHERQGVLVWARQSLPEGTPYFVGIAPQSRAYSKFLTSERSRASRRTE